MSSRSFFLGLGTGLIVTAGFLLAVPEAPGKSNGLSQEELKAIAKSQQLVLMTKSEYEEMTNKGAQAHQPVKEPADPNAPKSAQQPNAPAKSNSAKTPVTPVSPGQAQAGNAQSPGAANPQQIQSPATPESSNQPAASAAPEAKAPAVPQPSVSLRIPGATNATKAGEIMVQAGLIEKPQQLVDALRSAKKLDRIRAGNYTIPKGTSVDDIVKLITTPPKK
ncbi:MAG: hypothetical protein ACM32O_17080 [Clostridia bacterium]